MPLSIVYDDITIISADALVNSTNQHLFGFSGADKLIHEIGGEELEKECDPLRETCFRGQSTHTHAFNLNYKYIIHTVSLGWAGGNRGEAAILRSCYRTALSEADSLGCKSVATPLISAGSMGYPIPEALEIAITTINEYLALYSDMEVMLVIRNEIVKMIAETMFEDLDNYIKSTFKTAGKGKGADGSITTGSKKTSDGMSPAESSKSLEELLAGGACDFVTTLTRMIDERNLTDAQVYKRAGVSKGTFNKIINGGTKKPSVETVSALAMAMELSYDETVTLLKSAGMAFSDSSKFDIIVSYFIKNEIYDIWKLDEQLIKYGCKSLLGLS